MRPLSFAAATVLAAVAAASCGTGPPSSAHATTGSVPDPVREALLQALEAEAGPGTRDAIRARMRVTVTRSDAIPALLYDWGWYDAGGRTYQALAASSGGRPSPIRTPHEWSAAVWPIGWSPASARLAAVACGEAARSAGAHPSIADSVYNSSGDLRGKPIADSTATRLHPPLVTRRERGRWEVRMWLRERGVLSRYRCLFAPRTGRRGPLAEFERVDSIPTSR
jgi:hypothetical protein